MINMKNKCNICGIKIDENKTLCPTCSKKKSGADIVTKLSEFINFEDKFDKTILIKKGYDETKAQHYEYELIDAGLITQQGNSFIWQEKEKLKKVVLKYSDDYGKEFKENIRKKQENIFLCSNCGTPYEKRKPDDTLCKKCENNSHNHEYIKKILKIVTYDELFTIEKLAEKLEEAEYRIEYQINKLVDNNLVNRSDNNSYYLEEEKIKKFNEEYTKKQEINKSSNNEENNKKQEINKSLKDKEKSNETLLPKTIFKEICGDNVIILIKAIISKYEYKNVLNLLLNTKKYKQKVYLYSNDNRYDISIEYQINKKDEEKVMKMINRYEF